MTLRVAESSTGAGSISGGGAQDKDDYLRALKRKAELSRRVDKWMDKLMEETVDRSQLQRAVSFSNPRSLRPNLLSARRCAPSRALEAGFMGKVSSGDSVEW